MRINGETRGDPIRQERQVGAEMKPCGHRWKLPLLRYEAGGYCRSK